jgi:hypothetical protein
VAPLAPPPEAVVVANPMRRFPDPAYLVVGGKRDPNDYKGVVDTRTFYSNPAYYILDRGEPITEERSRYIRADFTDKDQMERVAAQYSNRFDIIIFDWAVAYNVYFISDFTVLLPFLRKMLKKDGELVFDPSLNLKQDPDTVLAIDIPERMDSMNVKRVLIKDLTEPPTSLLMQQAINEVYIKNKMYRASESKNYATFHNTSYCYVISKT